MTNKQKYALALGAILLLAGAALFFLITRPPRLGLDLRGGMSVTLTAREKPGAPVTEDAMKRALLVINERVNKLGVTEPEISRQGRKNILIQLPAIKNPQEALDVIGKTALLEFKPVLDSYAGLNETQLNELLDKGQPVLGPTELTGKALSDAKIDYDELNRPKVDMTFNSEGGIKFGELTGRMVGKRLAIVLDGKVMSAPNVQTQITGGRAEITGKFTIDEVKHLVLVLQTGALPVELGLSENRIVGPTLGRDSLAAGLRAGIIGLILVALFMVAFYRIFGFITWLALGVFGAILGGLLVLIGATLTLPGIAGTILTIGVAADSNIIIFERIKEEVRKGKSLRVAMDMGFSLGFKTFLDADLVTLTTAAILFYFGIGPVKGFALILMLGIFCDLFISLLFTRSILGLLGGLPVFRSPLLIGVREVDTSGV